MSAGLFRADLYARLAALRLEVPPLRERLEEIPILAEHFLHVYAKRYNRPACRLAPATLALFAAYRWPGNVHELQTLAKRIVVLGEEAQVRAELRKAMENGGDALGCAAPHRTRGNHPSECRWRRNWIPFEPGRVECTRGSPG